MQVPLSQERENIKREGESENEIFMGWLSITSITKKKKKSPKFGVPCKARSRCSSGLFYP
jgi:hypothetical protein